MIKASSFFFLQGFSKAPMDLRFATHLPLLAVVDGESNLHVYSVASDCQDVYVEPLPCST